ncbi:MAG: leucyl/phenylalanyl-tRNA--protein transferase [Alphaproteobacteria bacterium]|nr:leucyl/phenylalanyl-tRNA--protein transferase [Alphaproteobacteria bacterium]
MTYSGRDRLEDPLTPEILLRAYAHGLFPMAERRGDDELFWVDPERRGILSLESFHLPRRLARTIRQQRFEIRIDQDFPAVIAACAEPAPGREETWISPRIERLYGQLFRLGHAHSVEARREGRLVGGLYGVSIGAAFFGESMFSRETDASKVALAHLVARLRLAGYLLLDSQFITAHLRQFGAIELSRSEYRARLARAVKVRADFLGPPDPLPIALMEQVLAGEFSG